MTMIECYVTVVYTQYYGISLIECHKQNGYNTSDESVWMFVTKKHGLDAVLKNKYFAEVNYHQ